MKSQFWLDPLKMEGHRIFMVWRQSTKYVSDLIALHLANLMNFILSTGYIPAMLLEGLLTPVPKKDSMSSMYANAVTSVKWGPHVSTPFTIKQGVRQGGILSTVHYKLFNNDLLRMCEESCLGAGIGCFRCGAPTCADDVAVLGNRAFHVQCLVEMVHGYCSCEHYTIHPQKSEEGSWTRRRMVRVRYKSCMALSQLSRFHLLST